jgi:hypothetical protein
VLWRAPLSPFKRRTSHTHPCVPGVWFALRSCRFWCHLLRCTPAGALAWHCPHPSQLRGRAANIWMGSYHAAALSCRPTSAHNPPTDMRQRCGHDGLVHCTLDVKMLTTTSIRRSSGCAITAWYLPMCVMPRSRPDRRFVGAMSMQPLLQSHMSEPTTALDLRRATALPGGPVRARYRDHRRRDRTRCAMDGVGKR